MGAETAGCGGDGEFDTGIGFDTSFGDLNCCFGGSVAGFGGDFDFDGDVGFAGSIGFVGSVDFNSSVDLGFSVEFNGNLDFNGNVDLDGSSREPAASFGSSTLPFPLMLRTSPSSRSLTDSLSPIASFPLTLAEIDCPS